MLGSAWSLALPVRLGSAGWGGAGWQERKLGGRMLGLLEVEVGVASFRGGKTSYPPPGAPSVPFPFLVSQNNDADCSTSVIITLCLKIQNKSQERNWCDSRRILLPRGSVAGEG